MPVRMVNDDELEDFDDDSSNDSDYGYLIGRKIYGGQNGGEIVLYRQPSEDADIHAELSEAELAEADYYLGKGQRIEINEEGVWLKLAYSKSVWVRIDDQDIETD